MKPAAYNDSGILTHQDSDERPGEAWAVLLAGDYTAEHEQGVDSLLYQFGIDKAGITIEGRSMAHGGRDLKVIKGTTTETNYVRAPTPKNPDRMTRKKTVTKAMAVSTYAYHEKLADVLTRAPRYDYKKEITGAWSDRDFALIAWSDEAKVFLADLVQAFADGNVTIWLGGAGNNPFNRSGLIIAIKSRIPVKGKDTLNARDEDQRKLKEAVAATGIEDLLRKAAAKGKIENKSFMANPWYALAPSWVGPDDDTKHKVKFFLNPANQTIYNHGWYTVEELMQWAKGKGPVLKENTVKDAA